LAGLQLVRPRAAGSEGKEEEVEEEEQRHERELEDDAALRTVRMDAAVIGGRVLQLVTAWTVMMEGNVVEM
jgi:hypothetical protein